LINEAVADHEAAGSTSYPVALLLEKGRILQAAGAGDPAKMNEALIVFNQITQRLSTAVKPVDYFEARLELCRTLSSLDRKDDARRAATSTMSLYPECGSPALKGRFEELLKSLGGE
jgi:hypothetical protein